MPSQVISGDLIKRFAIFTTFFFKRDRGSNVKSVERLVNDGDFLPCTVTVLLHLIATELHMIES